MRPQSITILCILLFVIGTSLTIRSIGQFVLVPGIYTFFMLIISLLGLYCYYGLWNMKRWSLSLFFIVWAAIGLPMLTGSEQLSTIMRLRSLYLIGVVVAFVLVVFPHRSKLSGGAIWDFKRKSDSTE